MKRLLFAMTAVVALASCGGGDSKTETKNDSTATATPAAPAVNEEMLTMLTNKGCMPACHAIDKKVTGPAYKDVAKRYENASAATVDSLVNKVLNGGSGNWGDIPMAANKANVTPEEAKTLVTFILTLK
jgi:cytochrome c